MVSNLGIWIVMMTCDAQRARNAVMEQHRDSPVVVLTMLAVSAALDSLISFPDNPLRGLSNEIVGMAIAMNYHLSECLSALVEAPMDATWLEGPQAPSHVSIQASVERLRQELQDARAPLVTWRLQLPHDRGTGWDRRLHAVLHCIDELSYFDSFPPLLMVAAALREIQLDVQQGVIEMTAARQYSLVLHGSRRP